jgi:hypothetical protein
MEAIGCFSDIRIYDYLARNKVLEYDPNSPYIILQLRYTILIDNNKKMYGEIYGGVYEKYLAQ